MGSLIMHLAVHLGVLDLDKDHKLTLARELEPLDLYSLERMNSIHELGDRVERLDDCLAALQDMFAAGTDTTHTVMEWVMLELLRDPKVMEKLQNEVRAIGQGKSEITEDDFDKMQCLKLVIKETLRLHFPVPFLVPRESTRDINVMGYDIPIRTRLIVNAWAAIGRDPLLWEKPEEFQPERFLNVGLDFQTKLRRKFAFALLDGGKLEDMDMTEAGGIDVHRKLPILVVATPYSP
ncbi:norfluorocurarine oxidase-like [Coffea arabica]|uniref:Norfluorocurarine oxidase-like n=1 Tax=Coffea arabica TaxID=13443 RepID=A0A6P6XDG8_COFAR|nr:cytochrome P450 71A2-like [Coffea arabica]